MASYSKIMDYLNNLKLQEKEYEVIMDLLDNADPRFFTKILEEVVDGEMFWTDLYPIFDIPDYKNLLKDTFESQNKLTYEMAKLSEFRKNIINTSNLGITQSSENYDILARDEKRQRLYEMLQIKPTDNTFTIACKSSILNAIINYKAINSKSNKNVCINEFNELTLVKTKIDPDTNEEYDEYEYYNYLNPDDILISADDLIIPIDSRYQVLNDSDRSFMIENNMSEEQMKHFKALAMFLEQSHIFPKDEV